MDLSALITAVLDAADGRATRVEVTAGDFSFSADLLPRLPTLGPPALDTAADPLEDAADNWRRRSGD